MLFVKLKVHWESYLSFLLTADRESNSFNSTRSMFTNQTTSRLQNCTMLVHLPPRSAGLVVFESVASISLVILAVIGNVFILVALHRNPRLRNSTNIYIAALAVTDLLNACIPGTLFASTAVTGRLVFCLPACRLSGFLVHFLAYISMTTMTLTAVNRYFDGC